MDQLSWDPKMGLHKIPCNNTIYYTHTISIFTQRRPPDFTVLDFGIWTDGVG